MIPSVVIRVEMPKRVSDIGLRRASDAAGPVLDLTSVRVTDGVLRAELAYRPPGQVDDAGHFSIAKQFHDRPPGRVAHFGIHE